MSIFGKSKYEEEKAIGDLNGVDSYRGLEDEGCNQEEIVSEEEDQIEKNEESCCIEESEVEDNIESDTTVYDISSFRKLPDGTYLSPDGIRTNSCGKRIH